MFGESPLELGDLFSGSMFVCRGVKPSGGVCMSTLFHVFFGGEGGAVGCLLFFRVQFVWRFRGKPLSFPTKTKSCQYLTS